MEPGGRALGGPDDKLSEIRDRPSNVAPPPPGFAALNPGYVNALGAMIGARRPSSRPIGCSQQRPQGFVRPPGGPAVNAIRAKVPLKCRHHPLHELVRHPASLDPL